jgi:hypothetical protein
MHQSEAIRREHAAMDELARIDQELCALDVLICRFGQANQRWFDPEMVKRLSRARRRLLRDQEIMQELRKEAARYI